VTPAGAIDPDPLRFCFLALDAIEQPIGDQRVLLLAILCARRVAHAMVGAFVDYQPLGRGDQLEQMLGMLDG